MPAGLDANTSRLVQAKCHCLVANACPNSKAGANFVLLLKLLRDVLVCDQLAVPSAFDCLDVLRLAGQTYCITFCASANKVMQ